jgi:hypothetical protein
LLRAVRRPLPQIIEVAARILQSPAVPESDTHAGNAGSAHRAYASGLIDFVK